MREEWWNTKFHIFYKPKFHLFEIPKFTCPKCEEGILIQEKDNSIFETTEESKKEYELLGDEEEYKGIFSVCLKCNNLDCKEPIIISGITQLKANGWDDGIDPDTKEDIYPPHVIYSYAYEIQYMSSPIKLIDLPKEINHEIKNTLNKSFSLFWIDENACANKIRVVIEQLLDYLKVPKARTLQVRLEKLKDNPNLFKLLSAVKLIGNEGSHSPINLERKDLIDAYSIIELCLKDSFDKTREEVNQIAAIINQKYGNSFVG